MNAIASESALNRGNVRSQSQTYEDQIQQILENVSYLIAFVEEPHFDQGTLQRFWRGDTRANLTVQTIGRLLGRGLSEELGLVREMLERALPHDLLAFSHSVTPHLFETINSIVPATGPLDDKRTVVEQLQYAADVRQTVLQHVVTTLNQRYQMPRFRDLGEASRWTEAYSTNLHAAETVIQGTRQLLRQEIEATREYLHHVGQQIEMVEAAAEAKLGVVKRLRWVNTLETAEETIHNYLAVRAEQMESVTFSALTESKGPGFLGVMAQHTARRAPKLAMLLLGIAGTGAAAQVAQKLPTTDLSLPRPADPIRDESNTQETARLSAASYQTAGQLSARYTTEPIQQLVSNVQARERTVTQGSQARDKVEQFFGSLGSQPGRQTFVISSQQDLEKLLAQLTVYGYQEEDILSLLNLPSVDAFTHPLTLDVRPGRQQPILFPYNAGAQATAPQSAISQPAPAPVRVENNTVEQRTASMAPVLAPSEAFIVYRVQPNEGLEQIAARYGTTSAQILADNAGLSAESITRGQNLLIRRPTPPQASVGAGAVVSSIRSTNFTSQGSFAGAESGTAAALPATTLAPTEGSEVIARYGDTLFPTLDAMPADARAYFVGTIQEVSDFFEVRPGDVMGILRLEQNNAGWRLQEQRVSSAGASGVGQIVPRTWNGWASPEHDEYVRNVLDIEKHGGLGFDWSHREQWRAWKDGRADRSVLANSNADPALFENSVSGIARHLANWGLTKELAESDPEGFKTRLADAIAVYNSGRPLSESGDWVQSASNRKTTAQYVAEAMSTSEQVAQFVSQPAIAVASPTATKEYSAAFKRLYDMSFGITLSDQELMRFVSSNRELFEEVRTGKKDAGAGAIQLLTQIEQGYIVQGRSAIQKGAERPWPFVHNEATLYAQKSAIGFVGRTLTLYEMDDLMNRTKGERDAIRTELMSRADARLFMQAKHLFNQMLERNTRGLPVYNGEVAKVVQPLLAGYSPRTMDEATLQTLAEQVQTTIASMDEYKGLHSTGRFSATPLMPMPNIFKDFGVAVDYQAGGRHTGVDLANPRGSDGKEAPIYAVEDATVAYVGPLYCAAPQACRGGKAIVLDHGNDVYSIYSHNSEAIVQAGDQVIAGQRIGRQGNEGFSYGSHLHFEIHVGAPFSGDWQSPFKGGEFVDPAEWLPLSES